MILEKFGGKVLGVAWDPPTDTYTFKFELNLTSKVRGKRTKGPTLTLQDEDFVKQLQVTRRVALGVAHQLYDPYGLVATYVIKFKIRLRKLILLDLGWDDEIPEEERTWWTDKMIEMIKAEAITFPRSIWISGNAAICSMFQELTPDQAESTKGKPYIDLIYWIEGPKNPADWPSRGNLEWNELGPGTTYQDGPEMIRKDRSTWQADLSREFVKEIPEEETKAQFFNVMLCKVSEQLTITPELEKLIDLTYATDNLTHIKAVFARLARAVRLDDVQEVATTPDQADFLTAMHWLALLSRDATPM